MKSWIRAATPLLLIALAGCGSEEDSITLYPVKGTVTLNGKPMAGATITFVPDASNVASTPGVDSTGPEGTYSIRFKSRTGLSPGKYKVMVEPALTVPGGADVPEEFKDDPYMAQLSLGRDPGADRKEAAGEKSEFDAEVTANPTSNVFDFDVKAKAKK